MQTAPTLHAAALLASKPARGHDNPPATRFVVVPAATLEAAIADQAAAAERHAQILRDLEAAEQRRQARNARKNEARRRRRAEQRAALRAQRTAEEDEAIAQRRLGNLADQRAKVTRDVEAGRVAFVEDVEFMASTGETIDGAARRLGVSASALHKRLTAKERGILRPDLWERLRRNEIRADAVTETYGGLIDGMSWRGVAC